ncbi:MAG: hypothetical protein KDD16_11275 [Mangrovimonas sp.]|nr:hypothetical protein [Mangrovimonas sp.]
MTKDEVNTILQSIIIKNFRVDAEHFYWDKPIESINEDFKTLGYLVFLEQLINKKFKTKVPILENIISNIHTPNDISNLILKELSDLQRLKKI